MSLIRRFLSPEYWVVAEPGPLGRLGAIYLAALGLAFLAAMVLSVRWLRSSLRRRDAPAALQPFSVRLWYGWYELVVSLAGLLTIVGRCRGWPSWSARIWPPFLAALCLVGVLAYKTRGCRVPPWLTDQLSILALHPPANTTDAAHRVRPGRICLAAGICVHLAGIALILHSRFWLPWWLAPAVLAVLALPQIALVRVRRSPSLLPLTPLLAGYVATLGWWLYNRMGITVVGWQGLSFPNPMTSFFYLDGILLASVVYTLLCQLFAADASPRPRPLPFKERAWQWTIVVLMLAVSAWAVATYLGKRTHGATGSDPYAYAQMAVDLASRGTLLHRFPLFQDVAPLGIAWGPLLPSGYHLPINEWGDAPSVWATGASVLLAGGYRLLGEAGLYATTPIVALAALIATWFLVTELLHDEARTVRLPAAALTVALTATSPEHVDRLLVPMADAAAQLFTLLTLLFCLRAMRALRADGHGALPFLVLSGLSFGCAYWVRHTQLVLFLPVAAGLWAAGGRRARAAAPHTAAPRRTRLDPGRLWPVLSFSAAALLMAVPDIVYRWHVFGGIFATETTELPSMALQHVGPMAIQTARDALVAGEWGYLFPFALVGAWALARRNLGGFGLLVGAFAAVLVVHLTYRFLRLRDLISLFPLMNLAVSYGALSLVQSARTHALDRRPSRRLGPMLLGAGVAAWVMLSFALARWTMIDDPFRPGQASFGYMSADQRAAFERLASLTPSGAVIGASLNSGAVVLYSGRDSVRPYESWSARDWAVFVESMWSKSRRVYLLDDGRVMSDFVRSQESRYHLVPVAALAIPLFDAPGRDTGLLYEVVRDK